MGGDEVDQWDMTQILLLIVTYPYRMFIKWIKQTTYDTRHPVPFKVSDLTQTTVTKYYSWNCNPTKTEFKRFLEAYSKPAKPDLAYEICRLVMHHRIMGKMSQERLAKKIGTKQTSISRLENATSLPSLTLLKKIADAFGQRIIINFEPKPTK